MIRILINGQQRSFPKQTTGLVIAKQLGIQLLDVLAVQVNEDIYDLSRPIEIDATIYFLTWKDDAGKQVFWHSSSHLLASALDRFYPGIKFSIGSYTEQGFYYDVDLGIYSNENIDLRAIEKEIIILAKQNNPFIRRVVSKKEAIDFFTIKENFYKIEIIKKLSNSTITLYEQGNFIDLCKGSHLPHTGWIKAVKILNVSGAYWLGNQNNKQLTRIYGISFPNKKKLSYFLYTREKAQKRDHAKIGKELGLFTFSEKVGLGLPLWLPRGALLCDTLVQLLKKEQIKQGYHRVITPHIGHKALYITSGHYEQYQEDCFRPIHTNQYEEEYLLKPMNCPHHCEIYNSVLRSYKELPIRLAEFGTVYRYELHGSLHGLTRTRCFTQDDAHIFCSSDQVEEELSKVIDLVIYIFGLFSFKNYTARLSFRHPNSDKYIGNVQDWNLAEEAIKNVAQKKGLQATIVLDKAAFYGPKIDFMLNDVLGRSWQLGTVQLDYQLPIRFDMTYIGSDGKKHRPIIIHRAPFGSLERFIAILIEHTGGKFPLWLAPEQVVILSVSDHSNSYASLIHKKLLALDIRTTLDSRNETISKKIREHTLRKIPYILVVGEKEMNNKTVSVRKENSQKNIFLDDFFDQINKDIVNIIGTGIY